jgi:hypothetical protein
MRGRVIRIILCGLVAATCMAIPGVAHACAAVGVSSESQVSTCSAIHYGYDHRTRKFQARTAVTASDDPTGSKYEYDVVAACDQSVNGGSGVCANFGNCPPRVEPDGMPMRADRMQGMRAKRKPPGPMLPFGGAICVYTGKAIPMAAVVAAVREELVKQVGRPQISVQPATRGLIHWPVLFSAPTQHRVTLNITQPLPGEITADPSYDWDLGEGQQGTGAGHRYTQAVDPTRASSDEYYVKGTYDVPGEHSVELRLTWAATIHLGTLDVDLDPIVFTDTAMARVVSATNHLYDAVPRN